MSITAPGRRTSASRVRSEQGSFRATPRGGRDDGRRKRVLTDARAVRILWLGSLGRAPICVPSVKLFPDSVASFAPAVRTWSDQGTIESPNRQGGWGRTVFGSPPVPSPIVGYASLFVFEEKDSLLINTAENPDPKQIKISPFPPRVLHRLRARGFGSLGDQGVELRLEARQDLVVAEGAELP